MTYARPRFSRASTLLKATHSGIDSTRWSDDVLTLYSATNLEAFIDHTFRIVASLVPCTYVSAMYQPVGDGFLKERDSRGRVWSRAFMRRYIQLTPAIPMALANPGIRLLTTNAAIAHDDRTLHQTAFYREVMQRQGWRHGVVLCFWGTPAAPLPIFALALYRQEGELDFSSQDRALLEHIHRFVAPAVTRFHQISASNAVSEGLAIALRQVPRGIVLLDWRHRIVSSNTAGRRSCAEWNGMAEGRSRPSRSCVRIPARLLQVCDELRRELRSLLRQHADAKTQRRRVVSSPDASQLLASITMVCRAKDLTEPSFIIEFESTEQSSDDHVTHPNSPLARLTTAEREVALIVAEGVSNEDAAQRLGKTIYAVKFLLHRVYRKLCVHNRSQLCLLLRAHPAH